MKHRLGLLALCVSLLAACAPGVVTHNNAGNERFANHEYRDAIAEYQKAQLDDPDRAEPYYNAANAFNRQGEITATLRLAQQALKTTNTALSAQTWYNLGNAYFDAAQWQTAIDAYEETLRLDPSDADAKHNLELALQKLEEEQQQSQEQQNQTDQQSENNQASQGEQATPTPSAEQKSSESAGEQNDAATPQPAAEAQETEGMTPEEALQLLQAIIGQNQTLQERLQETYHVPSLSPEEDW